LTDNDRSTFESIIILELKTKGREENFLRLLFEEGKTMFHTCDLLIGSVCSASAVEERNSRFIRINENVTR